MAIENLNKTIIIFFTDKGKNIAEEIKNKLSLEIKIHIYNGMINKDLKDKMGEIFKLYSHIVFISSTGIAVRYIANFINNKQIDPSVTIVSDSKKYTIPLLSSHISGGLFIASSISNILENELVITTATDSVNIETIDKEAFLQDNKIVNRENIKLINSAKLKGEIISNNLLENKKAYIIERNSYREIEEYLSSLNIDDEVKNKRISNTLFVIKNPLAIGIGCRKNKEEEKIEAFLLKILKKINRNIEDIKYVTTAKAKINELGIINIAKKLNAKLIIHENQEIEKVQDKFIKSDFVKNTIGIYNVSASSAYLIYENLIIEKEKADGITISISQKYNV